MLEKLAYMSVGFDVLAAIATFMMVRPATNVFDPLLILSDYLILIEVVVAAIIVALLVTMKYYNKIINRISDAMFKMKHSKHSK
ncbi:MAG: hypothetical protein QXW10_04315 [Candidatus Micrarchaeaceae archaeon]